MTVLDTLNTLAGRERPHRTTHDGAGVIELEEGTRPVANMIGAEPGEVRVDRPVELDWIDADPELTLPAFRPVIREEN